MDMDIQELALSTRFFVDNREYEMKWNKSAKLDEICSVCQYMLNDILKVYGSDQVILKDHELQEYNLKDIVSFQVKEIFVYIPHKKEIRTFVNAEVREYRNVFSFLSSQKIKVEKFKSKQIRTETSFITLAMIKKQNVEFEQELQVLIQQRLNSVSISNPSMTSSVKNTSMTSSVKNNLSGSLNLQQQQIQPPFLIEGDQDNFPQDDEEDNGEQEPPSPKFGAVTQDDIKRNNSFSNGSSTPPPASMLGSSHLKNSDNSPDLKNSNKVPAVGTQQDYLRNQQHQTPNQVRGYTMNEVAQHKTDSDAWIVINGKIYDVTHYMNYHPGGKDKLMLGVGKDGTELFQKFHPWVNAHYILQKNQIGFVVLK